MLLSDKIQSLSNTFERNSPFGLTFALSRSLLAISTLLTLSFNSVYTLFPDTLAHAVPRSYLESVNLYHLFFYQNINGYRIFSILILLIVISGWRPRFTGVLQWMVSYTFFTTCDIIDGGDQINAILCLILAPITLMDSRKNHWDFRSLTTSKSSYKNIMGNTLIATAGVQMSYLYLQSTIDKLKVSQWIDGTSLYYWLNHNIFGAPDWMKTLLMPFLQNSVTLVIITWSVLILEGLLCTALVMSKSRRSKLLVAGLLFHLSIALTHGLISFFFSMSAGLVLYLLPTDTRYHYIIEAIGHKFATLKLYIRHFLFLEKPIGALTVVVPSTLQNSATIIETNKA